MLLLLATGLSLFSCTKRQPEEADYAPNSPWNPYPPDSSTNIDHTTIDVTLKWTASDPNSGDVLTYAVYFDTLNPPLTQIASGLSAPSYFVDSLSYNTTYYWKLYITDDKGVITCGPIWRFTTLPHANTAPTVPTYFYPSDNASWQYPTLNFGWNCTDPEGDSDTLYYDLYMGVTPQPPLTMFNNDTVNFWTLTGLNYTSTYYWKVVVRDNHYAYSSGPLYSFTTRDCPWFYKKELPSPRYGFGTAVVNGKIYVIGGTDGLVDLAEVLEYDPLLDTWTRKADMPTARSNLAATVWNGKIYTLGGGETNYSSKRANEVYDPLSDAWLSLASAPGSIFGMSAHAIKGNIYSVDPVYQYNINTNDWWDTAFPHMDTAWNDTAWTIDSIFPDTDYSSVKSLFPHPEYRYCCSAVYNNMIYVMGGTDGYGFSPFVDVYHPGTNLWTSASEMIGPSSYSSATMANNFIYVIGGCDTANSKRVRKYDPIADAWFIRSDLQAGRYRLGTAFANNRIYAIGGLSSIGSLPAIPIATVEEYQLDLDPKNAKR